MTLYQHLRHQAIIWASVDPDLYRHVASFGHSEWVLHLDLSVTETGIFLDNLVNVMAADALAPCFANSLATMALIM